MLSRSIRAARLVPAVLVLALSAPPGWAQADSGATRGKLLHSPRTETILSPIAIECLVLSDGGRAAIHVRNSTGQTLQAGRRVRWTASNGYNGLRGLPGPLLPGATVQIDRSHHATACSATLLRPDPVLIR